MAYQVKVSLRDIEPVIWRRLRIPGNITFQQLHQIIQAAFGWLDYHLYNFKFERSKTVVAVPDDNYAPGDLYGEDITELDARTTIIDELLGNNDSCVYEYDFGDSWEHEIIIERQLKDTKKNSIPECLDGARHRPPEDVGGAGGYEYFLNIIMDKKNPQREEMLYWAEKDTRGRIFDPEYFNISEVNRRLLYALEDDEEHARKLLTGKGLTGTVEWGWSDTCIKVKGKSYTMEHLGNLLLRLGGGSKVTIVVEPPRRRI
ncbi:MAG: plasmid pRiA4b ORF-3 family protein [Epulopiscium sp.]|jgi:hypothetical protein|nr:plasmid pRiA4b ORF-3 family protein [Candidatus Epulonipiscium sp.]